MGWSQSYAKDDNVRLFEKITGLKVEDLLAAKLAELGISITKKEEIVLSEDMYLGNFLGEKVYLNDGRVYQHKQDSSYCGDDSGHDHFGWFEEDENPEVVRTGDEDPSETQLDLDLENE